MQQRGFLDIETYVDSKKEISIAWLWCLKIDGKYIEGRKLIELLDLLDNWQNSITIWAFNLVKFEANYLKPLFFENDDRMKYFVEEELEDEIKKKKKKNCWTDLNTEYGNDTLRITWYNSKRKKITFLCGWLMVGRKGNLKTWGKVFNIKKGKTPIVNKSIEKIKVLPKKYIKNVRIDVDILEKIVETNLQIIGYQGKEYQISLTSYARWWWKNNSIIDLDYFFRGKIATYELWKKIKTAFRGGYIFVNEKYINQKIEYFSKDQKSAYLYQLIDKPSAVGIPIECKIKDCKHKFSIISYQYFNFNLREKKLPIFFKKSDTSQFLKNGKRIIWSAPKQEHDLIDENYTYEMKQTMWKLCFNTRRYLFYQYVEKFFTLKEKNKGVISEYAKVYCNTLWGSESQNPIKNKKIFRLKKEKENSNYKISYKNKNGNYYVEEILKKDELPQKYFNIQKVKFLPLGAFTTCFQRIDIIKAGELNIDRLLFIDTDNIVIQGKEKDFINPVVNVSNLPEWAKVLHLGEFESRECSTPFIKIIAAKNYLLIDEKDKVIDAVVTGLKKDEKILKKIKHESYKKGAIIKKATSKSRRLKYGGVAIEKNKDFKIHAKNRTSLFEK